MNMQYTLGFNRKEKEELLDIFKNNSKWYDRINNSFSFLCGNYMPTTGVTENCGIYWSGSPPKQYTYENYNGKIITLSGQIYITGIILRWDELKNDKNTQNSTPTIGYFYNPNGILTDASRLKYYLDKENLK